jgi:hypothetical protein
MRNLSPGKTLLHKQPGTLGANALALEQLSHLVDGRIGLRRPDASSALMRQVPALAVDKLQPGKLPQQALMPIRWHSLPIPEP